MSLRSFLLSSALLVTAAGCAASDALEQTDPIVTSEGTVAPQRNLLLSDLSVGSPGNGRARDETFDLPVTSFRVAPGNTPPGPGGSSVAGLVRGTATQEFLGAGNRLDFIADSNSFAFSIDTEAGLYNRTVTNIQVQDPVDSPGVKNSGVAKLVFANPTYTFNGNTPVKFQDFYDLGLGPNASIGEITAELTRLEESENEAENEFFEQVTTAANNYIQAGDQFFYGYEFVGGHGYVEATNMNSDDEERRTDTVAIVSLKEFYDTGEEYHAHAVFGHRTPLAEMPTTGTASYRGKVVGDVLTNNSVRSLTGGIDMGVNFTTGIIDMTIATRIREGANNAGGTTFLDYKTLTGSGSVSDTTFSGNMSEVGGNATGNYSGAFFGPTANEVGGNFVFGDDSSYATGAFTGRRLAPEGN